MMPAHLTLLLGRGLLQGRGEYRGFSIIRFPNFAEAQEAACGLQIPCEALLTCLCLLGSSWHPF